MRKEPYLSGQAANSQADPWYQTGPQVLPSAPPWQHSHSHMYLKQSDYGNGAQNVHLG